MQIGNKRLKIVDFYEMNEMIVSEMNEKNFKTVSYFLCKSSYGIAH